MSEELKFTEQQMQNFEAYERVRSSGVANMYSPQARAVTGLSREDYGFVMDNYNAMAKQRRTDDFSEGQ